MQSNLSQQSKDILNALWQLKNNLSQILPKDLCEYIIELIAKDQAHEKLLEYSDKGEASSRA